MELYHHLQVDTLSCFEDLMQLVERSYISVRLDPLKVWSWNKEYLPTYIHLT